MGKRNRHAKPKQQTVEPLPLNLMIGNCIVVKPGVKDPDYGRDIGGWQGRLTEIESYQPGKVPLCSKDSLALKAMPASMIHRSEEQGLDWTTMGLYPEEVERAEPPDTQADVDAVIAERSAEHAWDHLGKQGQRIHQILRDVDEDDELEAFDAWQAYLENRLKLPFEAEVTKFQERGPLQAGDRVTVTGFVGVEDLYGILVNIKAGRQIFVFPLCDLKVADKKSTNYGLTDDTLSGLPIARRRSSLTNACCKNYSYTNPPCFPAPVGMIQ